MALPIIYSIIAVCFRTREYLLSGFMELKRYHQTERGHTLLAQPRGVGGIVGCSPPGCSLIELQVAPRSACSQLEQSARVLIPLALLLHPWVLCYTSSVPAPHPTVHGGLVHLSCSPQQQDT